MKTDEISLTPAQLLRQKAEEKLKNESPNIEIAANEADIKKLLYELQVHQIELEMQNDELQSAYEKARIALKKITMIYDLAPMGFFTLGMDGSICELNYTGAEMLDSRRFSLIDRNFKLFVAEESRVPFSEFFDQIFKGNAKETCQVTLAYNSKPLCVVFMEGVAIEEDNKCLLSAIYLSGFKMKN